MSGHSITSQAQAVESLIKIIHGDCRDLMPSRGPFDLIIADPPYGDTSLDWDMIETGWLRLARDSLAPSGSIWVFGSLRSFMTIGPSIDGAGLRYAQEIVWEKQNGSGFHADRFRRVHELIAQFYRTDRMSSSVYNEVQTTPDAVARKVHSRLGARHMGKIAPSDYESVDGGPRLMRSVIQARNAHHYAIHATQKPVDLLEILIRTSCPAGGLVGDWFAGSGAVGEACALTGRRYVGCELDLAMSQKANDRLASLLPFAEVSA